MQKIQFDYFTGMEAEQYSFYRVPKVLFTEPCFKALSCEAKVLYGLMLDRMSLSIKNRWLDSEDKVYIIFTVEEIAELMNCGTQKAVKLVKELDSNNGIGLIEKKRLGLGKPNVIYVKNFMIREVPDQKSTDISAISVPLANWLLDIGAAPFLVSLLCNAILTAVSFALQMASYVFGISLVFGLMEDVGYMARISYVFDDTMTKLGLQGKAIMPFLVSFGCNIGGITGTRVIDSWGQRVMTIALSWVVPCASTWGVVGLVSGTFFGNGAVVVVLALFAVAFLHIFITYKVFGRSLNKVEGRTGLIMELPPYHKPHWKSLFGSVFSKMGNVLSRALRIIICISVIFWLLSYSADGNVANSIIYKVGTFIEPVTSLFGLPWQLFIAFVASAMGKEASLGVMASLFNTGSIWAAIEQSATVDTAALSTSMLSVISRPEALAFLFAFFFNMPCLMALTATTQETHSMKWTVRIALYYVLTALIMATIAYHVGLVIF